MSMFQFSFSSSSSSNSFLAAFASRPVTIEKGRLVEGPTSIFLSMRKNWYKLLDKTQAALQLESFIIVNSKSGEQIAAKIATATNFQQPPFAVAYFSLGSSGVRAVREALLRQFITTHEDGIYVFVGVVEFNSLLSLSRAGSEGYSLKDIASCRWEAVSLRDFFRVSTETRLESLLNNTDGTTAGTSNNTNAASTTALAASYTHDEEDEDEDDNIENENENNSNENKSNDNNENNSDNNNGYNSMISPLQRAYEARKGAKLRLPSKGNRSKVSQELLSALKAASGSRHPLVVLTQHELKLVLQFLGQTFKGVKYNTPEGPKDALVYTSTSPERAELRVGRNSFIITPEGVSLPDGRALKHAVIYHMGGLHVVNNYGVFALFLGQLASEILYSPATTGQTLAGTLPFAAKSGTAGGVEDNDRLRWEYCQYAPLVLPEEYEQFRLLPAQPSREVMSKIVENTFGLGLVPNPGADLIDARLVLTREEEDKFVLFTNKQNKLVKRISQQYPVVAPLEGATMKRSVIYWRGGPQKLSKPSNNVWRAPVAIALGLVFPPGAIIDLNPARAGKILNHLVFEGTPSYEVDEQNPFTPLLNSTPAEFSEGDVLGVINTKGGDKIPLLSPATGVGVIHTSINWECGYPRLSWRIEVVRRERALKARGALKGICTYARVQVLEGTQAELIVTQDANKSNDSILGPLDYICETVFADENQHNSFCRTLKEKFLQMNRRLLGDEAPTEYAVLSPDFRDEYEQILQEFWAYFGAPKTFKFESSPEYAQVMIRLRQTRDGVPIDGWRKLPEPFGEFPAGSLADGDPDHPWTNVLGMVERDGKVYVLQRTYTLDARDGAVVYWPIKGEYTTIKQALGFSRCMTTQVVDALRRYPQLRESWLAEGGRQEKARAEIARAFYYLDLNNEVPVFEGHRICDGPIAEAVKDLPPLLKFTGINTAGERNHIVVAPQAMAEMPGEGSDQLSLPEMLRMLLAADTPLARYDAIKRLRGVLKVSLESETFWKGGLGAVGVTAKVMGLPHIPLSELWVKRVKADSVYQRLKKVLGGNPDGRMVLLGRAPMATMCPLRVRVITSSHADWAFMSADLIYVGGLMSAWNGGDYDGDGVFVYPGPENAQPLNIFSLLQNLEERTGSNQLAKSEAGTVTHGSEYLGDWYEIKNPAKIIKKRQVASLNAQEAAALLANAERQQCEAVPDLFDTAVLSLNTNHRLAQAAFDLYEKILGGYEPGIFSAWAKAVAAETKGDSEADPWQACADIAAHLRKHVKSLRKALRKGKKDAFNGRPSQEAKAWLLLEISRGKPPVVAVKALAKHLDGDDVVDRLIKRWVDNMLEAYCRHHKVSYPSGDDVDGWEDEGGAVVSNPSPKPPAPTPAASTTTTTTAPSPTTPDPTSSVGHGLVLVPGGELSDERCDYFQQILERTSTVHLTIFAKPFNKEGVKKIVRARLADPNYVGEILSDWPERPPVTVVAPGELGDEFRALAREFEDGALVVVEKNNPVVPTILLLFLNDEKQQQDDINLATRAMEKGIAVKVIPTQVVGCGNLNADCILSSENGKQNIIKQLVEEVANRGRAVACRDKMVLEAALKAGVPVLFEGKEPVLHPLVRTEEGALFWIYAGYGEGIVVGDYDPAVVDRLQRSLRTRGKEVKILHSEGR